MTTTIGKSPLSFEYREKRVTKTRLLLFVRLPQGTGLERLQGGFLPCLTDVGRQHRSEGHWCSNRQPRLVTGYWNLWLDEACDLVRVFLEPDKVPVDSFPCSAERDEHWKWLVPTSVLNAAELTLESPSDGYWGRVNGEAHRLGGGRGCPHDVWLRSLEVRYGPRPNKAYEKIDRYMSRTYPPVVRRGDEPEEPADASEARQADA